MKYTKLLPGIIIPFIVCFLCSYFFQYPLLTLNPRESSLAGVIALLFVSGLIILIVYGALLLLNKHFEWYDGVELGKVILISAVIFAILMLLVYPNIPIPYEWIPNREMAADYAGFFIQLFTIIPAVICGVISGIYLIVKRKAA